MKIERLLPLLLALVILFLPGCAHHQRHDSWTQTGTASWYGKDFHGKPTATGEIYNMYGLSAAHKTLALGTKVKVTNLENRKHVVVPINDRGPFVGDRIIDMSYGAAKKLGMVDEGLARVRIEVISFPENALVCYTLQFGAYTNRSNAEIMTRRLAGKGDHPDIEKTKAHGQTFYRVRMGRYSSLEKAKQSARGFNERGFPCVVIGL